MRVPKLTGLTLTLKMAETFLIYRTDDLNVVAEFQLVKISTEGRLAAFSMRITGDRKDIAFLGLKTGAQTAAVFPDQPMTLIPNVRAIIAKDEQGREEITPTSIGMVIDADRKLWGIVRGSVIDKAIIKKGKKLVIPDSSGD